MERPGGLAQGGAEARAAPQRAAGGAGMESWDGNEMVIYIVI